MSKRSRSRMWISLLLAGLILLTGFGLTEKALNGVGLKKLSDSNDAYLKASFKRSLQTFAVLTAVKTGLAVVEGSEIGLGFGIEVGNVVRAVYDYVDLAWRTVLVGMAVLTGTRYLLQVAGLLDRWFLVAMLLSVYLTFLCTWFFPSLPALRRFFRGTAFFAAIVTSTLYVILPVSIAGGNYLSQKITAPSLSKAESGMHQFRNDLFPENAPQKEGLWSKIVEAKDRLKRTLSYLTQKTNDLIDWVIQLIAGYVFDCIVFPLGLFLFFYGAFKFLIRLPFDIKYSQNIREDVEAALKRFSVRPAEYNGKDS